MKIIDVQQGSVEWLQARAGIPTASEFDQLLTPHFKSREGQMVQTYLARKVAEAWLGGPLPSFNVLDMEFGRILEEEALPWFELEHGKTIQRVGFVTTDDERVGCSPDGLLGDDNGIEVKCPSIHTHVGYLLTGTLPKDYAAQVHGAMYVTGRSEWTFVSYCRGFPKLVIAVARDEEIQEKIAEALEAFLGEFDAAYARLVEINGGPPKRRPLPTPRPEQTFEEVIP